MPEASNEQEYLETAARTTTHVHPMAPAALQLPTAMKQNSAHAVAFLKAQSAATHLPIPGKTMLGSAYLPTL